MVEYLVVEVAWARRSSVSLMNNC